MLTCRDDPEFEGIRERAMQRIVSGEVDKATGRLIDWSKSLALEMDLSKKPQVCISDFRALGDDIIFLISKSKFAITCLQSTSTFCPEPVI